MEWFIQNLKKWNSQILNISSVKIFYDNVSGKSFREEKFREFATNGHRQINIKWYNLWKKSNLQMVAQRCREKWYIWKK